MPRLISIITPVFNEEENLPHYSQTVKDVLLSRNDCNFEIIFVDDGSEDRSWEVISSIVKDNKEFKALRLSRNMGSHSAVAAGLNCARGDAAVVMGCDLQDPPSVVSEFIKQWERGYDVVWGARASREDSILRVLASKVFEGALRRWAMPKDSLFVTGSFLLMDKKVLRYFNTFTEHNRITFATVAWIGFKQTRVYYNRQQRLRGKSGWTFKMMAKTLYDSIVGFSYAPIRLISALSFFVFLLTIPFVFYTVYLYFAGRTGNIGWISTILAISVFGSISLINMALILEYLTRIHMNTTGRPFYFVAEEIGLNEDKRAHELNKGP